MKLVNGEEVSETRFEWAVEDGALYEYGADEEPALAHVAFVGGKLKSRKIYVMKWEDASGS